MEFEDDIDYEDIRCKIECLDKFLAISFLVLG